MSNQESALYRLTQNHPEAKEAFTNFLDTMFDVIQKDPQAVLNEVQNALTEIKESK